MSKPIPYDPEFPEHRWLVDQIAKLVGPRELTGVSDAELHAILDAHADVAYSLEQVERLAARFWTEVSQPPVPSATLPVDDDSANTPLPPSSPVLGFLGNLTSLGGLTPTLWSLLILVSGMLLTLAVVVVTIRSTQVRVEVHEAAKTEGGVPQPSAVNPSSSPKTSSSNFADSVARPAAAQPLAATVPSAAPAQASTSAEASHLAVVTMAAGRWAQSNRAVAVGEALQPGLLDLTQGIVEIAFRNGAVVLLESPAKLNLLGPERVLLISGRAVAHVPGSAVGFTIETSEARLVDQGTEFGVSVPPEGPAQVQVFEGAVIVEMKSHSGGTAFEERLTKGQAREIPAAPAQPRQIAFQPRRFLRRFPVPLDRRGPESPYNQPRLSEFRVMPAPGKVVIDGDLSDWDLRGEFRAACLEPYAADYHVEAAMMYDAQRLYLAAHVADPAPMCNVVDPSSDLQFVWAGGSVVVRLCADRLRQWPLSASVGGDRSTDLCGKAADKKIVHINMCYSCLEAKARMVLGYGTCDENQVVDPPGVEGAFRKDAKGRGYTLEYAVPWRVLNVDADPPRTGDALAATWYVHWSDEAGRTCIGKLIEVVNPAAEHPDFSRGSTWGKAIFGTARE
jgi:hypothetical protein